MTHPSFAARFAIATALVSAFGLTGTAQAQSAGTWMLRGSFTQIVPKVGGSDLTAPSLAGTRVGVGPTTRPGGGITYMLTDNVAFDFPLSTPYKHELVGAGAIAGVGKIGDVKSLPVTLLVQWRFLSADSMLRPYIGAGPTYAKFYKGRTTAAMNGITGSSPSNPTLLNVDAKFAPTFQLGGTYAFAPRWFADIAVAKTILTTTAHLSTGQSIETRLNPTSMTIGVGYKF